MFRSSICASKGAAIAGIVLSGLFLGTARNAQAARLACRRDPSLVKNVMALNTAQCERLEPVPRPLTQKEISKMAAAAKSPADHLKVAGYYTAEANRLQAEGAGYADAAAVYEKGLVKNLMALDTVGRYRQFANLSYEKARSNRELAAAQARMARKSAACVPCSPAQPARPS